LSAPPTPVSGIFTAPAYIVQTKISEAYSHLFRSTPLIRAGPSPLILGGGRSSFQLSTFEIKELNGPLVAIGRNMNEPLSPSALSLTNIGSLVSKIVAYSIETPKGVRIGELHGSGALIPNSPYLKIKDANGKDIAVIIMRAEKKPGAGFFSRAVTTWALENPGGEELARISWGQATGRLDDWTVRSPEGATIAEVQPSKVQDPAYQTSHEVKILNPIIDPYLVLATFFATPPGTR
jgi:hypothetical protein